MRKPNTVKHEERRAQILEAATRVFQRHGIHGATMAEICAEARMSPGHLYHYFPGKEAILAGIVGAVMEMTNGLFDEIELADNVVDGMVAAVERFGEMVDCCEDALGLELLAEVNRNPTVADIVRSSSSQLAARIAEQFRKGQARGHVTPAVEAGELASAFVHLMDVFGTWLIRDKSISRETEWRMRRYLIRRMLEP